MERVKLIREFKAIAGELGLSGSDVTQFINQELDQVEKKEQEQRKLEQERVEQQIQLETERAAREREEREHSNQQLQLSLEIEREKTRQRQIESESPQPISQASSTQSPPPEAHIKNVALNFAMDDFQPSKQSIDIWLQRLEKFFVAYDATPEQRCLKLVSLLKDDAYQVYCTLPPAAQESYEEIKASLLRHYRISATTYRNKFRSARRHQNETFQQMGERLRFLLKQWIKLSDLTECFDDLSQLILTEAMLETMPADIKQFVNQNAATSFEDVMKFADRFLNAKTTQETVHKQGRGHPPAANPARQQQSQTSSAANELNGGSPKKKEKFCNFCKIKNSHYTQDCRKKQAHSQQSHKGGYTTHCMTTKQPTGYWSEWGQHDASATVDPPPSGSIQGEPYFMGALLVKGNAATSQEPVSGLTDGDLSFGGQNKRQNASSASKHCLRKDHGQQTQKPLAPSRDDRRKPGKNSQKKPPVQNWMRSATGRCPVPTSKTPIAPDSTHINATVNADAMMTHQKWTPTDQRDTPDAETIQWAQQNDPTLNPFRRKLARSHHPPRVGDVTQKNGILYRVPADGQLQLIVPLKFRHSVLEEGHAKAHQRHLGTSETTALILTHYFWKGLRQDVRQYVKACHKCRKPANRLARKPDNNGILHAGDIVQFLSPQDNRPLKLAWNGNYTVQKHIQGYNFSVKRGTQEKQCPNICLKKLYTPVYKHSQNPATRNSQWNGTSTDSKLHNDVRAETGKTPSRPSTRGPIAQSRHTPRVEHNPSNKRCCIQGQSPTSNRQTESTRKF